MRCVGWGLRVCCSEGRGRRCLFSSKALSTIGREGGEGPDICRSRLEEPARRLAVTVITWRSNLKDCCVVSPQAERTRQEFRLHQREESVLSKRHWIRRPSRVLPSLAGGW